MITKRMLSLAFNRGVAKLINSPNNDGIVCRIGNGEVGNWFYFGGLEAEEYTNINQYIDDVGMDRIIVMIYETLTDFLHTGSTFEKEYDLYESILTSIDNEVSIVKLTETAKMPTRDLATTGLDLYADTDKQIRINPFSSRIISTGLKLDIPETSIGIIVVSNNLAEQNICLATSISFYKSGECTVCLYNGSETPHVINPGECVAQLVLMPYNPYIVNEKQ